MGLMFSNLDTGTNNNSTFTKDVASATKLLTSGAFGIDLQQEIYERSAMIQSGLLQTDARLNGITGVIAEMPFAAPLNYTEEQVNSSGTWGLNTNGYYSIQKQRASTQYAPIVTRGAAFGMDDLSQIQTGFDALANIRSQLATDMNRKITQKIVNQLTGVLAGPLAAHSITAAAELTANDVLGGKALLGERGDDLDILIVHPDVKQHLIALGMTTFQGSPGSPVTYATQGVGVTQADIGYFAGFRVISDSQVPVDRSNAAEPVYSCYLAASGLIRTGSQFPLLLETERNILSLQDTLAVTYNRCDHIVGTSWVAGAFKSDPSNADLADGANWYAAYQDTRLIPLVEVKAKSTFKSLVIEEDDRFAKHPAVVAAGDFTTIPDGAAAGTDGEGLAGASAPVAPKAATTKTTKKD
jgi:hypothetical protein